MSKGSWKRPVFVSHKEYCDRYTAIDWGKNRRVTLELELEDGTGVTAHVNLKGMKKWNLDRARTGRFSSAGPNLANVPRTDEGEIPEDGTPPEEVR